MSDRLTPQDLDRIARVHREHGGHAFVPDLLAEVRAAWAERDEARGEWDDLHRETEKLRAMLDERDAEVDRLRAAVREAVEQLVEIYPVRLPNDIATVAQQLRDALEPLTREGGER